MMIVHVQLNYRVLLIIVICVLAGITVFSDTSGAGCIKGV